MPGAKLAHCVVLLDAHALGLAEHLGRAILIPPRNDPRQGRRHSAEFRVRRPKLLPSLCAPLLSNWSCKTGARCERAALPPHYELRNDLNVARISETKIAVRSQAAKWVPLGNLL